jgi:hypothetical protein
VWTFVRAFQGVALAAAGCGTAALVARRLLAESGVGPAPRLGLAIAAGAVVYVVLAALTAPEIRAELSRFRRRRAYDAGTTSIAASSGSSAGP